IVLAVNAILFSCMIRLLFSLFRGVLFLVFRFFFFNDTATTEIYTLSLHDALPISRLRCSRRRVFSPASPAAAPISSVSACRALRSEEHTSELQSLAYLVCRLLLEKKKIKITYNINAYLKTFLDQL